MSAFSALRHDPLVAMLAAGHETTWLRGDLAPAAETLAATGLPETLVEDARARFTRFAPWFADRFPATRATGGILESPLLRTPALQAELSALTGTDLPGQLWIKRDDALPVSGSIKARGGIHEVLQVVETILRAELAGPPDVGRLLVEQPQRMREILAGHGISVGSTGNLGLSIGVVAAELGLATTVHMSADARDWKKQLLRERGVDVIEHSGDFSTAVEAGRQAAEADPAVHFVDDESSLALFAGYAVAARRLAGQLAALDISIDEATPLIVHLPCGVGGGPGGLTYGLKQVFGDHVRCVFAEPVAAPAMFLGVRSGRHAGISVQDIGLDGRTAADGLAVGRPSRLVGEAVGGLIDGFHTVADERMKALVAVLARTEGCRIEPSAAAGIMGPWRMVQRPRQLGEMGLDEEAMARAHHIVWSTGGSLVPSAEMDDFIAGGAALVDRLPWG